jgi:hypothetical protein
MDQAGEGGKSTKGEKEMRKLYGALLVLALIALVACAKPPQQQIDTAKAALKAAEEAQADIYAPDSLKAAKDKDAALDAELATQQSKFFKSYKVATQLTTELQAAADKAKEDAIAGKEQAKKDAEAAIAATETAINEAKEILKKAPKGKGSTADVKALEGDIANAETAVNDAKTAMTGEKFKEAKEKADGAKATVDNVKAQVEAAIAAKGGKKAM